MTPRNPLPDRYPIARAVDRGSPLVARIRDHGGPLLEVPVSGVPLADARRHAVAMYRSIEHWAPLLNGYSSYWPAGFEARMAIAARLPDPSAAAALRRDTGLALVLAHAGGGAADPWRRLYLDGGNAWLHPLARDGDDLLFDISPAIGGDDAP